MRSPAYLSRAFVLSGVRILVAALFLVAVLGLSAGFAKIVAMGINWLCAQRLTRKYVIADKCFNLCVVAAYPLVLLYGLGWCGPRLLVGGSSIQFAPPWWIAIIPGATGFVFLVASTIRYWRYRPPACEVSVSREIVDLRIAGSNWRRKYIGAGRLMSRIAALPLNEQFTIDVSTKTYHLPGLPDSWNGLSIVHVSDLHFYSGVTKAYFEVVCDRAQKLKPDLFIFSGDLLDNQSRMEWLPDTLGRLQAPLGRYFVLGNHDWYYDPAASRRELTRLGWIDLSQQFVLVNRQDQTSRPPLLLCGDETPWMGSHPDLTDAPREGFRILVSHTPDNITWARSHGIHLMLAGHTHGGQVRLPILGPVYSPSRFGCRYASGVFWLDPTLMYVSRGVSGKEPIRYDCPPEVTRLVLTTRE